MQKRKGILAVLMIVIITAAGGLAASLNRVKSTDAQISSVDLYFVDREMMRLVPSECYFSNRNTEQAAKIVIRELIKGRDDNEKIKRMIPDIPKGMSVYVKDMIAYVDISHQMADQIEKSRLAENLIVYQIVNSLTSIKGIDNVRFTIGGEGRKDLAGFIDMRETFIHDDYV